MLTVLLTFHVLSGFLTLILCVLNVITSYRTQDLQTILQNARRLIVATVLVGISGGALAFFQTQTGSTTGLCTKLAVYLSVVSLSFFLMILRYAFVSQQRSQVVFAFRSELSVITTSWVTLFATANAIGW